MSGKTMMRAMGAALLLVSTAAAFGQEDASAIGGPEDVGTYEETGAGPMVDAATTADWTAADSAFYIPSYETYGDWNTDQIFEKRPDITDTVALQLAWQDCDHHMPITGRITSPFGIRHGRHHYGTDLKLQTGDTVRSAFGGMIRISRYHRDFGNVVVVRHPNGLETLYGHMSKRLVEVGDHVEAGDVLGLGGSTGRSTGSHLHFETRYLGHPIDPETIFNMETGTLRADAVSITPKTFRNATAPATNRYTVRRGDTLYGISRRTGISVPRLCKLNRLRTSSTLRVGQHIRTH
jgi:murein DD-endopeptidase MepM/ murein hydrolase activator NlpD